MELRPQPRAGDLRLGSIVEVLFIVLLSALEGAQPTGRASPVGAWHSMPTGSEAFHILGAGVARSVRLDGRDGAAKFANLCSPRHGRGKKASVRTASQEV
jgi:hypothetical protein